MYPPGPGFDKQSYSGMKLAGYSIPEGSMIKVCGINYAGEICCRCVRVCQLASHMIYFCRLQYM